MRIRLHSEELGRTRRARLRKRELSSWRVLQRCVLFFATICVIPVVLVLLVTTDHYMRPHQRAAFLKTQFMPDGKDSYWMAYNLTAVVSRLEKRRQHLKNTCRKLHLDRQGNDSLHRPNPWEYLISPDGRLIWCNVFKAASSSWMYNFNILAGYSPRFLRKSRTVPLSLARQRYPRPSLETLVKAMQAPHSVSFLIVRHPLERLLSAYRDKMEYALPHTHHQKLGREIIAKYRPKMMKVQAWRSDFPTPPPHPTFPEFVDFLIDRSREPTAQLDMHWTPVTQFCTPCLLPVQHVAHTETLHEDQHCLIRMAGLQGVIEPQWRNPGQGGPAGKHVGKYYRQLSRSQILHLYHIYRYDFELFNYTLTGFLDLGRPDEDPSAVLAAITVEDGSNNSPKVY